MAEADIDAGGPALEEHDRRPETVQSGEPMNRDLFRDDAQAGGDGPAGARPDIAGWTIRRRRGQRIHHRYQPVIGLRRRSVTPGDAMNVIVPERNPYGDRACGGVHPSRQLPGCEAGSSDPLPGLLIVHFDFVASGTGGNCRMVLADGLEGRLLGGPEGPQDGIGPNRRPDQPLFLSGEDPVQKARIPALAQVPRLLQVHNIVAHVRQNRSPPSRQGARQSVRRSRAVP